VTPCQCVRSSSARWRCSSYGDGAAQVPFRRCVPHAAGAAGTTTHCANAAHYLDTIANKSKRVHRDSRRGAAKEFGGCLAGTRGGHLVTIDFAASEGRRYHAPGDPRLGDFSGPIPSFKVGPKLV
jgi:hypothetical protein